MNSTPLVSIIIPLYNAEKFIAETINSALAQTYKNIEIIIIDDGSTDNSLAVAKQFESEKIKVYAQENKGASAARNYGLREAKGEYIQFLDADDLLSAEKIEKQISIIKEDDGSISFCENINFKISGIFDEPIDIIYDKITNPFNLLVNLYGGYDRPSMIAVHSWLVPLNIIASAGYWNEHLCLDDDGEFFCRVVLASQKVVYCENVFSYYRKSNHNSLSSQKDLKHLKSELLSIKLKTSYLLKIRDIYEVRRAMAFWYMRIAIISYPKFSTVTQDALSAIRDLGVRPHLPIMGGNAIEAIKNIFGWKFVRILHALKSYVAPN